MLVGHLSDDATHSGVVSLSCGLQPCSLLKGSNRFCRGDCFVGLLRRKA
jgi:hypothetical protein